MAALYRSILLFCILISSSFVSAQFVYDFEEEDGPWQTSDSSLWSISAEEASQGIQSVKFSISEAYSTSALTSIETGYTISKVRTAHIDGEEIIIASSFEGTVLAVSYGGVVLWENKLSGFYNHDVWCDDLMGDDDDEILLANADGSIYCLNSHGELMWDFRPNEAPMNAVTVIHENNIPYVVCGGYDLSFYYLEADGDSIKAIHSSTYSQEKSWGSGIIPPKYRHIIYYVSVLSHPNIDTL